MISMSTLIATQHTQQLYIWENPDELQMFITCHHVAIGDDLYYMRFYGKVYIRILFIQTHQSKLAIQMALDCAIAAKLR